MKKIKLTQGKYALVDDEDYEWLNQWKWYAHKSRNTYYAARTIRENKKNKTIKMHRLIMNAKNGQIIDHKDRNGLNNKRKNLRFCNHQQNIFNSKKRKDSISEYKGVFWRPNRNKWFSRINIDGKRIYLGHYENEINAAKAYDKAAIKYFGEFANLNFKD